MERVINTQLMNYLLRHHLISKHQHGFLRRHSTASNLLETLNDFTLALNNKLTTDVIYIYSQKAFDTVSRKKTSCQTVYLWYFWRPLTLDFGLSLSSYSRSENFWYKTVDIISGVPQGSVLYYILLFPTLFLLYINDLPECLMLSNVHAKLRADDAKLYCPYVHNFHSPNLQEALNSLCSWADSRQLRLAIPKCLAHK